MMLGSVGENEKRFKEYGNHIRPVAVTITVMCALFLTQVFGQKSDGEGKHRFNAAAPDRKFFIRSPYLSFTNGVGYDVSMYELHIGYRITRKDIIAVKAATWSIFEPMGIQLWDPNLLEESEWFSGRIREYGAGPVYQRLLWKGLYASLEIMPMKKIFLDESGKEVDEGFRLYTSYHVGYRFSLLKDRLSIEPQIHCNYWPINSSGPQGFKEQIGKYGNYFLFEPNLYVGINF
jgi:hypothetical protein